MSQLQFKSLHFENFKTFSGTHDFKLDRQPGLYYIAGANKVNPELGANGVGKSTIFDALLWCLWGKTGRDNRPADAIKPWNGKGKTSVSLDFICGNREFNISRYRNPNSLRIQEEGSEKAVEVQQEEIPKLLGLSEEMFRRTLVLGQFGTLFLDLKPEQQAQMFTEALDLNVWLRASDVANQAAKKANSALTQAQADLVAQDRMLTQIAADLVDTEKRAELFEADRAARIAKIKRGIEVLKDDLAGLEEQAVDQPKLPDQSKSRKLLSDLGTARTNLEVLLRDMNHESKSLEELTARIDDLETRERAKKKTCPTCGQEISQAALAREKAKACQELSAHRIVVQNMGAEKTSLTEKGTKLRAQLAQAQDQERLAVEAYDAALKEYSHWHASVSSVRGECQRQERTLADETSAANVAAESVQRLRTRRAQYRAEQGGLKEKVAQSGREAESATFWVDAFREIRLSIIDQTLIELEMSASRHAAMLGLDNWGIKFDTEKETQSGKVNYSFTVLLYPPGQDQPVRWESYSGGESQRWSLAVTMALSEVLLSRAGLSPNFETYDEPTKGLSSDGVADLLAVLRERALELGRAIYFCDHHSLDRGDFDGALLVTKDKKGSTFKWL